MTDACSTTGLNMPSFEHCFKFLKNPWTQCALLVIIEICLFQLKLLVMVTPRYLVKLTLLIEQLLRKV